MDYDYYTIEPYSGRENLSGYVVYGHGEYGPSSVLAGQAKRQWLGHFDTLEEAQEEWPEAEVTEWSTRVDPVVPDLPPDWFDPYDAGEVWHEEDY
jgi:hypothetical protein